MLTSNALATNQKLITEEGANVANEELKKAVANIMEKELDTLEKWLTQNWDVVPVEVKNIIVRGKDETIRKINKYK